jgi:hypothetical protein
MINDIHEIQALATKYSVAQLKNLADLKLIDPIKAVMAGNMINHIQKQNAQLPSTTVAQDLLGIQGSGTGTMAGTTLGMQGQEQGPTAPPQQAPQQPPQMAQAPAGIEGLPAGDVGNYAGGGIVAFDDGGRVPGYAGGPVDGSFINTEPQRVAGRGFVAPSTDVLQQALQQVDAAIAAAPPGRGRSALENRRNELRSRLGGNVSPVATTAPAVDQSAAETARLQRQNDMNPFATDNNVPPPPLPSGDRVAMPSAPIGSKPLEPPKLGDFNPNAIPLTGATRPPTSKVDTLEAIKKQRETAEEAEGFNKNLTKEQLNRLEEKQKKLDDFESRAGGEALFNFGLGLLGAKRGQEFETAGKSGQAALSAYKSDVKDLRSAKDKLDERAEALRLAENQARKTNSAADIARRDTQEAKFDAQQMEFYKAENKLKETQAQVGATVYSAQEHAKATNYHTQQAALTAQDQLRMERYKTDVHANVTNAYTNAVNQGRLDERKARTLIEAADSYIKNNASNPTYMQNPMLLQQDAMEHARRIANEFMPNAPGARPTTAAPAGNLPPLNSDRYRTR